MNEAYIAGLIDGEGCLNIEAFRKDAGYWNFYVYPRFDLGLICEREYMEDFCDTVGIDNSYMRLRYEGGDGYHNQAQWAVTSRSYSEVRKIRDYLEDYPPILKNDEYKIWKEAISVYENEVRPTRGKYTKKGFLKLIELRHSLKELKPNRSRKYATQDLIRMMKEAHPEEFK